jgi:methionyl-tRNA formyltransferase
VTGPESKLRPRRLVFLGTPQMAVPALQALHAAGFEITLVVSRPDKRRGRGSGLTPSPVKAEAQRLGLPVTDDLQQVLEVEADLGVVVAYGRIIRPPVLGHLPLVNVHFSLLPRWRGAAPVERAILAGDSETGVCIMTLAPELDTGDIHRCETVDIAPEETADELGLRLTLLGARILVEELHSGLGPPTPQDGTPTYAEKLEPADHRLDPSRPAAELHRVVRLGRAWCHFRDKRLKVLAATVESGDGPGPAGALHTDDGDGVLVTTGGGRLRLLRVQPEGRKPVSAADWRNGVQPRADEALT